MTPATFSTAESVGVPGATWGKKLKDNLQGKKDPGGAGGGRKPVPAKVCTSITDGLKAIYFQKARRKDAIRPCAISHPLVAMITQYFKATPHASTKPPVPSHPIPYGTLQVKPIEEAFKFSHFFSPFMTESDFDAKPSILLLGQYSTGKVKIMKM